MRAVDPVLSRRRRDECVAEAEGILRRAGRGGLSRTEADRFDDLMDSARAATREMTGETCGAEYRHAFWSRLTRQRGDETPGGERRALSIGTDSAGGYLAPDDFSAEVIEMRDELSDLRRFVTVLPAVRSGSKTIAVLDSIGDATFVEEGKNISESDPAFASRTFKARRLARIVKTSMELAQDGGSAFRFALNRAIARSFAGGWDGAFCDPAIGNGTAAPRSLALDATTAVTTASASAITVAELRQVKHGLKGPYQRGARWLMNRNTLETISLLTDGSGSIPRDVLRYADGETILLGSPVILSSKMPDLAAGATGIFYGDFAFFTVLPRVGLFVQPLRELYAESGQVGFLGYERFDGRLIVNEAIQGAVQAAV